MLIPTNVFIFLLLIVHSVWGLMLISRTQTTFLSNYDGFSSVVVMHFQLPLESSFVSFKFEGDKIDFSVFGCPFDNVTVYLKYGSLPVVNPDGSKFPENFLNEGRPDMHSVHFLADKSAHYINITAPHHGSYYAIAFLPYVEPNDEAIEQDGLTPQCHTFLNASLFAASDFYENIRQDATIVASKETHFSIFVPEGINYAAVYFNKVAICQTCGNLTVDVHVNGVLKNNTLATSNITQKQTMQFSTLENAMHYIEFRFEGNTTIIENWSVTFLVKLFSACNQSCELEETVPFQPKELYTGAIMKQYFSDSIDKYLAVKEYSLMREGQSDLFVYTFDLALDTTGNMALAINVTSTDVTILKFNLADAVDLGGTLYLIVAFKPRISGRYINKEPANHVILACISNGKRLVPTWPNQCVINGENQTAPIVLNITVDNGTISIPYPESGEWFVSFKLFCGACEPCNCSAPCQKVYKECTEKCRLVCDENSCSDCLNECNDDIKNSPTCSGCNCDGPCRVKTICNSSVIFDVSSQPCSLEGRCADNGKCSFSSSEGVVYSTCECYNNYRGWDCSDDTYANSFATVVLELMLLVLSNLMFIPAVYTAYKRKYYVEAIVYSSSCFFSTFYHACDAGENIISFCLLRLSVLQFSDFFSGILSIWVTLIAMAYLIEPWPAILKMFGAIALAIGTMINKTSLWLFVVPSVLASVIVGVNWFMQYRKTRTLFPSRRYLFIILPTGLTVVAMALIMFATLETEGNYKYVHSMWHILMALGIMILLPNKKTFLP